ncbi:MAG: dimethylsulfoniopropionate demethylase [Gammaproteobacteria bacterium]|jgi:dimethylsulfoniopropionate demethylase
MSFQGLNYSRRLRSTPYTPRVESLGVSGYSIVNHTVLPKGFRKSVTEDYWHLREHVQLWDVGCQRQVELKGRDAAKLAQMMTPRDLRKAVVGQCLYAPMIDHKAGMLNDPIILKLADDHFWFSISDSDVLLWAKGLAHGLGLTVEVDEPDVWPMSIQGPKSDDLMAQIFGDEVRNIGFFKFKWLEFKGHSLLIARSGFSKQGGFEIYLDRPELALDLWDSLWEAGQPFEVSPGCPNLIERIEGGLFSYGNEMTRENNPIESGLEQYCQLDGSLEYIGSQALLQIANAGVARQLRGIRFDSENCPQCKNPWALSINGAWVGQITSAAWSPRFKQSVALAMVEKIALEPGTSVRIQTEYGDSHEGTVTLLPME